MNIVKNANRQVNFIHVAGLVYLPSSFYNYCSHEPDSYSPFIIDGNFFLLPVSIQ
jgi:hypothetical protein